MKPKLNIADLTIINKAKERLLLHYINNNENLYKLLNQRAEALLLKNLAMEKMTVGMIESLARTLEAKDRYTEGHSQRVADYAVQVGIKLGFSQQDIENLRLASLLHDMGKIGIPERILNKSGSLTETEFEQIKAHPSIAARMLEPLDVFKPLIPWIEFHHERYDGKGYPRGIAGKAIPLEARIISLADSYDAMTSDRPYRKALPIKMALREIAKHGGTQFDPQLTEVFLEVFDN